MARYPATEVVPDYYLPLVAVTLTVGNRSFLVKALVDSGADGSVLRAESLKGLVPFSSLPPASGDEAAGAGGAFEIRRLGGTLTFAQVEFRHGVAVAEPGALPVSVLGRDDFFRHFVVRFEWFRDQPVFDVDPRPPGV